MFRNNETSVNCSWFQRPVRRIAAPASVAYAMFSALVLACTLYPSVAEAIPCGNPLSKGADLRALVPMLAAGCGMNVPAWNPRLLGPSPSFLAQGDGSMIWKVGRGRAGRVAWRLRQVFLGRPLRVEVAGDLVMAAGDRKLLQEACAELSSMTNRHLEPSIRSGDSRDPAGRSRNAG